MATTTAEAITGGKLPGLSIESLRIGNTVQYAVSAAGSTNADATQINAGVSRVICTTVGAGQGVRLPAANRGDQVLVVNNQGTNALLVYPGTGNRMNAGTVTTVGATVAVNSSRLFTRVNDASTEWVG
jgi:hypothetical protein